jgi:cation transport regulator ChaB
MQQRVLILEALRQAETQAGEGERKAAPDEGSTARAPMARSASKREAASDAPGKPVEAFRRVLEEKKDICWADLVPQFRENYYEAYDEMASALFSTDDPFVIYNTVRYADFSKPQEVAAHVRFIAECDAEKHQVALRALARTKVPKLLKALNAREDLPESVKDVLTRKEEEAIEAAVAAAQTHAESEEEDDDSDDQPKAASRTKARSTRTKAQSKEDAE